MLVFIYVCLFRICICPQQNGATKDCGHLGLIVSLHLCFIIICICICICICPLQKWHNQSLWSPWQDCWLGFSVGILGIAILLSLFCKISNCWKISFAIRLHCIKPCIHLLIYMHVKYDFLGALHCRQGSVQGY